MTSEVKVLFESEYEKHEQTTIKDQDGELTYTVRFIKVFHQSLPNGWKWVQA
jgi:hypothetical protein